MNERIFLFLYPKAENFLGLCIYKSKINSKKQAKVVGKVSQNSKKQAEVVGKVGLFFKKQTNLTYFFGQFLREMKTSISEISTQNPKITPYFFKNSIKNQ